MTDQATNDMDRLTDDILTLSRRRRHRSDTKTDISLEALNKILKSNEAKTKAALEAKQAAEKQTAAHEALQKEQARRNDLLELLLQRMEYFLEWSKELLGEMIAPNLEQQATAHTHILRALQYVLQKFVTTGDHEATVLNESLREVLEIMFKHAATNVSVGGTAMTFQAKRDQTIQGNTITGQHVPKE